MGIPQEKPCNASQYQMNSISNIVLSHIGIWKMYVLLQFLHNDSSALKAIKCIKPIFIDDYTLLECGSLLLLLNPLNSINI